MTALLLAILAADLPARGDLPESLSALDADVAELAGVTGLTAASLAVDAGDGEVLTRCWGWANRNRSRPVTPKSTFRLGSNTKPFTSAAVVKLVKTTDLGYDTPVLPMLLEDLKIRPRGGVADDRWEKITVDHLLKHEGGWDRDETFDPLYKLDLVRKATRPRPRLEGRHVVQFMLTQPLQFDPGSRDCYSNFGYVTLGRVVEAATGKDHEDAVRELIAGPLGIEDLRVSNKLPNRRHGLEVDYPKDDRREMVPRDASGGMACSPTSLCKFMNAYWISGRPRKGLSRGSYYHYGSLPGTTMCWMVQRPDGVNWALAVNARRDDKYLEDLEAMRGRVNNAIDAWRK